MVAELKNVVLSHNGSFVVHADQATHEIVPDLSQEEEEGDYCRTIDEQVDCNRSVPCPAKASTRGAVAFAAHMLMCL